MPNRIIKESICTSESVERLSWFEEVFFYRLIVNCDDYGRFDARPAVLKARLFPLKERITLKEVSSALTKLASIGIVMLYERDSKPYLCLPTWEVHQTVRAKKSKYPAPADDMKSSEIICKQMQADVPVFENPIRESESNSLGTVSNETVCRTDVQRIIDAWNTLGLTTITKIVPGKDRDKLLRARIKDYGVGEVLRAIENIRESDFLMGRSNSKHPFQATFDWFIRPNNFPKVLDGNYKNGVPGKGGSGNGASSDFSPGGEESKRMKKDMEALERALKLAQGEPL